MTPNFSHVWRSAAWLDPPSGGDESHFSSRMTLGGVLEAGSEAMTPDFHHVSRQIDRYDPQFQSHMALGHLHRIARALFQLNRRP